MPHLRDDVKGVERGDRKANELGGGHALGLLGGHPQWVVQRKALGPRVSLFHHPGCPSRLGIPYSGTNF